MIGEVTVFILGAGASAPYGLPTGQQLRKNIIEKTRTLYGDRVNEHYKNNTTILDEDIFSSINRFTEKFDKSSNPSIDLFLNRNKNNPMLVELGKKAIAINILEAERTSKFREKRPTDYGDWYTYLFKKMTEMLKDPDQYRHFGENKILIITFNYDRSLEHFLYESLKNSFSSIDDREYMDQLRQIKIHHIYGKINNLPWEVDDRRDRMNLKHYGDAYDLPYIELCANNIRTIYEERERPELDEAKRWLSNAKQIYFLGFGYAKENLDVLGIPESLPDIDIYGTAKGYNPNERTHIIDNFFKERRINLQDTDCLDLLRSQLL